MQHTEIFSGVKIGNFFETKIDDFNVLNSFAQNIECVYILEPPYLGSSIEYLQTMLWIKNKNNEFTPHYKFYYSFREYILHGHVILLIN